MWINHFPAHDLALSDCVCIFVAHRPNGRRSVASKQQNYCARLSRPFTTGAIVKRACKLDNRKLGRGVFTAPWVGRNGEVVVIAISQAGAKLSEVEVPPTGDPLHVMEVLWQLLESADPIEPQFPALQLVSP